MSVTELRVWMIEVERQIISCVEIGPDLLLRDRDRCRASPASCAG